MRLENKQIVGLQKDIWKNPADEKEYNYYTIYLLGDKASECGTKVITARISGKRAAMLLHQLGNKPKSASCNAYLKYNQDKKRLECVYIEIIK